MTRMPVPPDHTPRSSPGAGLTVLVVLILGVAGWMYSQRPTSTSPAGARVTPPPEAMPADLPGFRPDAWFFPDDALLGFVEATVQRPGSPLPAALLRPALDPATLRHAVIVQVGEPPS